MRMGSIHCDDIWSYVMEIDDMWLHYDLPLYLARKFDLNTGHGVPIADIYLGGAGALWRYQKNIKKNPLRHLGNSTLYQPSQNFQGLVLSGSQKTHKKTPSLVPSTNSSTNRHASSGVGPATAGPACTATASTASTSSVTGGEVEAWMMGWNLEMGHNNLQ